MSFEVIKEYEIGKKVKKKRMEFLLSLEVFQEA